MKKTFEFYHAEPLLAFINQNRDRFIGQHIKHFYSSAPFGEMADTPLAFELDDYCVIVSYYFYSDMTLYVVSTEDLKNDLSLNFLFRDIPESSKLELWVHEEEFPFIGHVISDIHIRRFSHEFEINPSTGETRPDGGDYFSVITIVLSSGQEFNICAAATFCDGYIEIW